MENKMTVGQENSISAMHPAYPVPAGGHIQFQARGLHQNIKQDIGSLLARVRVEREDGEVLSLHMEILVMGSSSLGSCHKMAL